MIGEKRKVINVTRTPTEDWSGTGCGEEVTTIYECYCGKGTISEKKDTTPGFRSRDVDINCGICKKQDTENLLSF